MVVWEHKITGTIISDEKYKKARKKSNYYQGSKIKEDMFADWQRLLRK